MPYEFAEWDEEPVAQAGSSRTGGPPRKSTGVGVIDPPGPPRKQGLLLLGLPSFASRILAGLILAALVLAVGAIIYLWFSPRP